MSDFKISDETALTLASVAGAAYGEPGGRRAAAGGAAARANACAAGTVKARGPGIGMGAWVGGR